MDTGALRASLLPITARGDLPRDRNIGYGARAWDALWIEPQAEALRLGASVRAQPEHLVLAVLHAARRRLLRIVEDHAATYHLLRLRLAARPPQLPWSADVVRVLGRAHTIARQAAQPDLYPNYVMLALAEHGPEATPGVDNPTLRTAIAATALCRPATEPLPATQPVAVGWNLGSSLLVGQGLRRASALAHEAGRAQVEPVDIFAGLCQALDTSPVRTDISVQQTTSALKAAQRLA